MIADYIDIPLEYKVLDTIISFIDNTSEQKNMIKSLSQEDFYDKITQYVYLICRELMQNNYPVNMQTIMKVAKDNQDKLLDFFGSYGTYHDITEAIHQLKILTVKRKFYIENNNFYNQMNDIDFLDKFNQYIQKLQQINCYITESTSNSIDASSINSQTISDGFSSGFFTFDYNCSGLKDGTLTLLSGFRGDGKTTFARQLIISAIKQKIGSYFFIGESSVEIEKQSLAKLTAEKGEINYHENLAGKKIYSVNASVEQKFNKDFQNLLHLSDVSLFKDKSKIFDTILNNIKSLAKIGVKFFVIDNMMIINQQRGVERFDEQKRIVELLKDFAVEYQVAVLLIAHQGKGKTSISGVAEQENLADTIIRYFRPKQEDSKFYQLINQLDIASEIKSSITGAVFWEKERMQGGTTFPVFLGYDPVKSACIELTDKPEAQKYEENGFWVKYISKYGM